ncbi:MAG: hypothetical protein J5501_01660 [Ruminococcus sp.]|nr:hypothetical protein [Ruminococcus sp.]
MKDNLKWLIIAVVIAIAVPLVNSVFLSGSASAFISLILFMAVDPVFSVISGISASKDVKKLWWRPAAFAVLFFAGAWLFFGHDEKALLFYAGIYLLMGVAAMISFSASMKKKK